MTLALPAGLPAPSLPPVPIEPGAPADARAWAILASVPDPEVPAVSVVDLGIVREVRQEGDGLVVVLTPTYSGCPATEQIERSVLEALESAGLGPVRAQLQRAPAWTTDWITAQGRQRLLAYGIAPPGACAALAGDTPGVREARLQFMPRRPLQPAQGESIACPRCGSAHTEQLSAFGSTACKSLWRCQTCREPFEHFKPI